MLVKTSQEFYQAGVVFVLYIGDLNPNIYCDISHYYPRESVYKFRIFETIVEVVDVDSVGGTNCAKR